MARTGQDTLIKRARERVQQKLKVSRSRRRRGRVEGNADGGTPGSAGEAWFQRIVGGKFGVRPVPPAIWNTPGVTENPPPLLGEDRMEARADSKMNDIFRRRWKDRWKKYLEGVPEHRRQPAQMEVLSQKKLLKLHSSLAKAEGTWGYAFQDYGSDSMQEI
ncbi:MAG: hypothetical protein MMC33_008248 [Icmadophila ericetorum]|nr:hypothetical protein [Icmadophila ericetorum]